MRNTILAVAAGLSLVALPALANEGQRVGRLECVIHGGAGFVIGSSKRLRCDFKPSDPNMPIEPYYGVVNKFGLDVGVTGKSVMQWWVLAPTKVGSGPGALAGTYTGASAEATAGVGAGANVLVGGSHHSFTLQPISVQAQTGLNLAAGVTEFKLRSAVR
jgi:hypothetical protein